MHSDYVHIALPGIIDKSLMDEIHIRLKDDTGMGLQLRQCGEPVWDGLIKKWVIWIRAMRAI